MNFSVWIKQCLTSPFFWGNRWRGPCNRPHGLILRTGQVGPERSQPTAFDSSHSTRVATLVGRWTVRFLLPNFLFISGNMNFFHPRNERMSPKKELFSTGKLTSEPTIDFQGTFVSLSNITLPETNIILVK